MSSLHAPQDSPAAVLDAVEAALDAHRYQHAWETAKPLGDLRRWRGPKQRRVAARLATHLGAQSLGRVLAVLGGREHPDDVESVLASTWSRIGSTSVRRSWQALDALRPRLDGTRPDVQTRWWCQRATLANTVRDFEAAWQAVKVAESLCDEPWVLLQAVQIYEREDRLEAARQRIEEIVQEYPRERLAVQLRAHLMCEQGDHDGAYQYLLESTEHLDYPHLHLQLAGMDVDAQRWSAAMARIRRYVREARALRFDRRSRRAVTALRATVLCRLGHRLDAADLYEQVDSRGSRELVARLRDPQIEDRRVVLDVPWVRQHHDTCSPATLTAVCRYWGQPAEHVEIAEEICYGGTRSHSERRWARQNELLARELTVDWPTAVELVDRGIPFTLVTADAVNAHLQAVVGYDVRSKSLICRDPSSRWLTEYDADGLIEGLAASGPRGMVLLPPAEATRLEDPPLELPDSELYDLYDQVEQHLAAHRREAAQEASDALRRRAPGHRLSWMALRALAAYDRDMPRLLAAVDGLLALYPDDDRLQLTRLALLADLERRQERLASLRQQAERPAADPSFGVMLASALLGDTSQWRLAERLLERAIRLRPNHAEAFDQLAQLAWRRGRRDEAHRLFRWAACLAETDETYQAHFLIASHETDRLDEALELLRQRFESLGSRSAGPAMTLLSALEMLSRDDEAAAVVDEATRRRPDDGAWALRRVAFHARRNEIEAARVLLGDFEGRCDRSGWLEMRAEIAELEGDLLAALDAERQILDNEPSAALCHQRVARLIALCHGQPAALEHLRAACERFPYHVDLHELLVHWSRLDGAEPVVAALDHVLQLAPDNAWAWRELASTRILLGQLDAAREALERAAALEPEAAALENLRGQLAERQGRLDEAAEHLRRAIELDPDNVWAIRALPATCHDAEKRRETLRWIAGQLERSTTATGLLAFHEQAARYLPPEEVEALLRRLLEARDLWPAHQALAAQTAQMGRLDEAAELLGAAIDRYPFQAELRLLAARVYKAADRPDDQREALEALLAIDPRHGEARVGLARFFLEHRQPQRAIQECEIARARDPFDPQPFLVLADLRWAEEDAEGALGMLEKALELDPNQLELWDSYHAAVGALRQPRRAEELARQLLETRRSDPYAWASLARVATERETALEAIEQALALAPRSVNLHVRKAQILAAFGDPSAAFAACRPPELMGADGHRPLELVQQEADVLADDKKFKQAIQVLQPALDEDPSYRLGWQRLAEWALEISDWEKVLEATDAWQRLDPLDSTLHGFRGKALRAAGRLDEALAAFRRALEIDPAYVFAAFELVSLLEARDEGREALEIVAGCAESSGAAPLLVKAVILAARHGGHRHAGRFIQRMAASTDTPPQLLHELLDSLEPEDHYYLKLYDKASLGPDARAPLAAVRIHRLGQQQGLNAAWRYLAERFDASEAWGLAAVTLLDLHREKKPASLLGTALKHRQQLCRPTTSWAQLGYILATAGHWRQAIQTLNDYERRENVESWVLNILVVAHRELRQYAKSHEIALEALRLPPEPVHQDLRIWVALWQALNDDVEAARDLDESLELDLEQEPRLFFRMAKALAACAGRRGDGVAFTAARAWLRGGEPPVRCAHPTQRKLYDRVARKIARSVGGFRAWLWAEGHFPR